MIDAAQRYALIAQITHNYNQVSGKLAGKKAIQKLFYVLQRRDKRAKIYDFSFYNYGVFSQDLARDIAEAERYHFIDVSYDAWANAYSIKPSDTFAENKRFVPEFYSDKSFQDVFGKSAKELELITTIMFVCEEEKISDRGQVLDRVLELKPKFLRQEVEANLEPYCSCL